MIRHTIASPSVTHRSPTWSLAQPCWKKCARRASDSLRAKSSGDSASEGRHPAAEGSSQAAPAIDQQSATRAALMVEDALKIKEYQARYRAAMSMSELYNTARPEPIPLEQHQRKRIEKDTQELVAAGKKRGVSEATIRSGIDSLQLLLPDILNLHRLSAANWVAILSDASSIPMKLISLKDAYPGADVGVIFQNQPRMLLKSPQAISEEAAQVLAMLKSASDPSAIIQDCPELATPETLSRCLATIQSMHVGQDPVKVLERFPDVLRDMGESRIELTAEYGEMTTNV